jgi:hypothetical protein
LHIVRCFLRVLRGVQVRESLLSDADATTADGSPMFRASPFRRMHEGIGMPLGVGPGEPLSSFPTVCGLRAYSISCTRAQSIPTYETSWGGKEWVTGLVYSRPNFAFDRECIVRFMRASVEDWRPSQPIVISSPLPILFIPAHAHAHSWLRIPFHSWMCGLLRTIRISTTTTYAHTYTCPHTYARAAGVVHGIDATRYMRSPRHLGPLPMEAEDSGLLGDHDATTTTDDDTTSVHSDAVYGGGVFIRQRERRCADAAGLACSRATVLLASPS